MIRTGMAALALATVVLIGLLARVAIDGGAAPEPRTIVLWPQPSPAAVPELPREATPLPLDQLDRLPRHR